jgi:hypothetical protein
MRLLYIEIKEHSDSTISFDSYLPILLSYKKPCSWLAHNADNLALMIQGYFYALQNHPREAEDLFVQAVLIDAAEIKRLFDPNKPENSDAHGKASECLSFKTDQHGRTLFSGKLNTNAVCLVGSLRMNFKTSQISEVMLNTSVPTHYHQYLLTKIKRFNGPTRSPTLLRQSAISLQYSQSPFENELVQLLNLSPPLWLELAKHEIGFISTLQNIAHSTKLRSSTILLLQHCINYLLNPNYRLNGHEEEFWLSLILDESMQNEISLNRQPFHNPCENAEQNSVPFLKELAMAKSLWCRISNYHATLISEDASADFATTTHYAASARITALFITELTARHQTDEAKREIAEESQFHRI